MRLRTITPLVVAASALTGCVADDRDTIVSKERSATPVEALGAGGAEGNGDPSTDTEMLTYRFSVEISGSLAGEQIRVVYAGAFDPVSGDSIVTVSARDLKTSIGEAEETTIDPSLVVERMTRNGTTWSRGLLPELGYPDDVDPTVWYEVDVMGSDDFSILGSVQSYDELRRLLAPFGVEDIEPALPNESTAMRVELSAAEIDELREETLLGMIAPDLDAVLSVGSLADGRIGRADLDYVWEAEPVAVRTRFSDFGAPLDLPDIVDPRPDPNEPAIPDLTLPPVTAEDVVPAPGPDSDKPLRIYTFGAHDDFGVEDVTYVVESDGDLLQIRNGNIFTGPGGYTTWSIGPEGYETLLADLRNAGLAGGRADDVDTSRGRTGVITAGGLIEFSADGLDLPADELTPEQYEIRRSFLDVLRRLGDRSRAVGQPVPWVPSHLSFVVSEELDARYYSTEDLPWPFDEPIADMIDERVDGAPYICLDGTDAATAWQALLIDGVNQARVPVIDSSGARYELGFRISYPGYQLYPDPCPAVTSIDLGAAAAPAADWTTELPIHIVDPLLLDAAELGPEWTVSTIIDTPAPFDVAACPTPGASHDATSEFDGWMMRTSSAVSVGGPDLLQLVGFAEVGVDVDGVVDAIAPYDDCAEPFADYGITAFESGDLVDLPAGVTSGSYWRFERGGRHNLVADIGLDSRFGMVIGLESDTPLSISELTVYVDTAAGRLPLFEEGLERCRAADPPASRCRGLDRW